jgi:hypothetical protein
VNSSAKQSPAFSFLALIFLRPAPFFTTIGSRCVRTVARSGSRFISPMNSIGTYLGYRDDAHLEKRAESGSAFPRLGFIPLRYDSWLLVTVRESAALLRVSCAVK